MVEYCDAAGKVSHIFGTVSLTNIQNSVGLSIFDAKWIIQALQSIPDDYGLLGFELLTDFSQDIVQALYSTESDDSVIEQILFELK